MQRCEFFHATALRVKRAASPACHASRRLKPPLRRLELFPLERGVNLAAHDLEQHAHAVCEAMVVGFQHHGLASDHWITRVEPVGARIVDAGQGR